MMKALLEREHWTLLFDELKAASREGLAVGEFRSVGFREALRRCRAVVGVSIQDADVRHLERLYTLRNRVIHYRPAFNLDQAYAIVAASLNVFLHLHRLVAPDAQLPNRITGELIGFDNYVTDRMRRIAAEIEAHERPEVHFRCCPDCGQEALVIADGKVRCVFCGAVPSPSLLATLYSEGDYGACPRCDLGQLGYLSPRGRMGVSVCVLCGITPTYEE